MQLLSLFLLLYEDEALFALQTVPSFSGDKAQRLQLQQQQLQGFHSGEEKTRKGNGAISQIFGGVAGRDEKPMIRSGKGMGTSRGAAGESRIF